MPQISRYHKPKIRIIFLIDRLGGGGAERVAIDLATHLPQEYDVLVVTTRNEGNSDYVNFLKDRDIPLFCIGRKTKFDIKGFLRLRKLIINHKPDIIHSHKFGSNVLIRLVKLTLSNFPILICHEHSWAYDPNKKARIRINRILAPLSDSIIAVSENDKTKLVKIEGLPQNKITVIYNGIDFNRLTPTITKNEYLASFDIAPSSFVASILANLLPVKNHEILIRALPEIIENHPEFMLLIVGKGYLRKYLQNLVFNLKIENNVKFLGFRSDIGNIFSISDLVILPSLSEGHPVALLEAMAAGKTVIASNVGGVPEVIKDGVTGLLVQANSVDALTKKILLVLEDFDRFSMLGNNAYKEIRSRFSLEKSIAEYTKLYSCLMESKYTRNHVPRK